MKTVGWTIACLAIFGSACFAQDIAGDWQGALQAGPRQLRLLVHVDKSADGGWTGWLTSLDPGDPGVRTPADSISLEGGDIKIGVAQIRGRYEGKLGADGSTMSGTWFRLTASCEPRLNTLFAIIGTLTGDHGFANPKLFLSSLHSALTSDRSPGCRFSGGIRERTGVDPA
jgi:hypothetical protein